MIADSKKRYRAFISYSHDDEAWARWLHRAIETYRVPGRLVGRESPHGPVPRRLMPVFRDRDELASSSDLGDALRDALEDSDWLLVLCSPRAAVSRWVGEEIRSFIRMGREDRVLALLVDGEPNAGDPARECFPAPLRSLNGEIKEPLAADVRDQGDGRNNARLKLIAGMLGVGFDELRQREAQRRRRQLFVAFVALCGLLAVLGWFGMQAREEAEASRQAQYMNTIAQVQVALRSFEVGKARALLRAAPEDLRDWEWRRLLYLSDTSLATLYGHPGSVRQLVPNARGTALVSRSVDGAVRRWDLTGYLETPDQRSSASTAGQRRAWTDGRVISLLDAESGSILMRWSASGAAGQGHAGAVNAVTVSPDGNRVASVGDDGTLRLWDPVREALLVTRELGPDSLNAVAYSPDGELLAVAGHRGRLTLLSPSGQHKRSLRGHEDDILALSFSPDGKRLLSGDATGLALVWDMFEPIARLRGHKGAVAALGFRADGTQAASAGADGTLRIWDEARGIELERLYGHDGAINSLVYLGGGSQIVTAGADGTLKLWRPGTVGKGDREPASGVAVAIGNSPDQAVRVQVDGSLVHLSAPDGSSIATLRGHTDVVTAVALSASGSRILTASADGSIRLWKVHDGLQLLTVADSVPPVSSLAFADDDRAVARFASGQSQAWPVRRSEVQEQRGDALPDADVVFLQRNEEAVDFAADGRYLDALIALEEALQVRAGDPQAQQLHQQYAAAASRLREADRLARRETDEAQALKALKPLMPAITVDERDARKPVTAISFRGRSERLTDGILVELRAFPALRELRFDGTVMITDEGLRHIGRVSTLEVLAFNKSRNITDEGLRHLAGLDRLRVIDLSETTLTGTGLVHLRRLPIRELELRSMSYHSSGYRDIDLAGIAGMLSLQTLNMDRSSATDDNLATIAGLKHLRRLHIPGMRAGDEALGLLQGLSKLEFLDLSDAHSISDQGLEVLGGLQKLHTLHLRHVGMLGPAMQQIGRLQNLRDLDIRGNFKLTDEELKPLAQLQRLEILKLGGGTAHHWVTDETMDTIAQLPQLRRLSLFGLAKVTDAGIQKLGGLKQLEWLDIGRTGVTAAGLSVLDELPKLSTLHLRNSKVKWDAQQAIEARYPRLSVDPRDDPRD